MKVNLYLAIIAFIEVLVIGAGVSTGALDMILGVVLLIAALYAMFGALRSQITLNKIY